MIRYERTEWYGIRYLFQLAGSTLPRSLPMVLSAGVLSIFFSVGVVDHAGWPIRDFFGDPYAMQVLGLVFGYLSISRLNVSYNRYWEGVHLVKVTKQGEGYKSSQTTSPLPPRRRRLAAAPPASAAVNLCCCLAVCG